MHAKRQFIRGKLVAIEEFQHGGDELPQTYTGPFGSLMRTRSGQAGISWSLRMRSGHLGVPLYVALIRHAETVTASNS